MSRILIEARALAFATFAVNPDWTMLEPQSGEVTTVPPAEGAA